MKELLKNLALPLLIITSFILNEASAASKNDQDTKAQSDYEERSYERDEGHAYEYINEHPDYDGDMKSTCDKATEKMLLKACKVYHGT